MLSGLSVYRWQPLVVQVAELAFERLIHQPLVGIHHLVTGTAQAVLPLARAAWRAVVQAVRVHLTLADTDAVREGVEQLKAGLALLAWPLVILTTVLFWRAPFLVQALLAVAMLGLPLG